MSIFLDSIFPYVIFFTSLIVSLSITFFSSHLDKKSRLLLLSKTFFYIVYLKFVIFLAKYCNENTIFFYKI